MVPFESLGAVFYSLSIVTIALSCISSEIKRDIGRKSWLFSYSLAFDAPVRGGGVPHWNIAIPFGMEKLEWWGYLIIKKIEDMFSSVNRIPSYGQTSCQGVSHGKNERPWIGLEDWSLGLNYVTVNCDASCSSLDVDGICVTRLG